MILDTRGMGKGKLEQEYLLAHVQNLLVQVAPWILIMVGIFQMGPWWFLKKTIHSHKGVSRWFAKSVLTDLAPWACVSLGFGKTVAEAQYFPVTWF